MNLEKFKIAGCGATKFNLVYIWVKRLDVYLNITESGRFSNFEIVCVCNYAVLNFKNSIWTVFDNGVELA